MDFGALFELTRRVTSEIKAINTDPTLTAEQKKVAIRHLQGITRAMMMKAVNDNYSTGPGLDPSIHVSAGRPRGAKKKP